MASNKGEHLTEEEIRYLTLKMYSGDKCARNKLIEGNLKLIPIVARRYTGLLPMEDLIQAGTIGLIKAVDKFKLSKGCKFSTHAVYWIRQEIKIEVNNTNRNVRLPIHVNDDIYKYRETKKLLEKKAEIEPTISEIANDLNMTEEKVKKLTILQHHSISLNTPITNDSDDELQDFLTDDSNINKQIDNCILKADIKDLLSKVNLTNKELEVLIYRFGLFGKERRSLEEIGKTKGLTRERIRQIEAKALMKIRNYKNIEEFAVYMVNENNAIKSLKKLK